MTACMSKLDHKVNIVDRWSLKHRAIFLWLHCFMTYCLWTHLASWGSYSAAKRKSCLSGIIWLKKLIKTLCLLQDRKHFAIEVILSSERCPHVIMISSANQLPGECPLAGFVWYPQGDSPSDKQCCWWVLWATDSRLFSKKSQSCR